MQPDMGDRRSSHRGISGESIPPRVPSVMWFALVVSIFAPGISVHAQFLGNNGITGSTKAPASEYVGSSACADCHQEIYRDYSRTGMGRSTSLITPEFLKSWPTSASLSDKNTGLHFDVYVRDAHMFQSEYQLDPNGKEIFRDTRELQWIIGAGQNGFGGLVRDGEYLFQAPLSFYSKAGRWELSPGYELANAGFTRPILPGCISCHSGRPNALPEGNGHFATPFFSELAIGCENCHGPGLAHMLAHQIGLENEQVHDSSIVRPVTFECSSQERITKIFVQERRSTIHSRFSWCPRNENLHHNRTCSSTTTQ